jgi:hypothetical protein
MRVLCVDLCVTCLQIQSIQHAYQSCFDSIYPLQEAMHHQCVPLHTCYQQDDFQLHQLIHYTLLQSLFCYNKLIIMCLVSITGTDTSELLCSLTVPLTGWSALELSVFCVEMSSDLQN